MWTRAELKMRAKANIRRYYWAAVIVSLIFSLLGSNGGGSSASTGVNAGRNVSSEINYDANVDAAFDEGLLSGIGALLGDEAEEILSQFQYGGALFGVLVSVLVVAAVIGLVVSIFIAPVIQVGRNRFYMESRLIGESAGIGKVLWGFTHNYLNIVWVMFVKNLILILGTICCVVPGIYFAYCYCMVPYILAENPDMSASDALRMSKEMMDGQKFKTWGLEISFWGWWFLCALTCSLCTVFVMPYYDATFAELYAVLRRKFNYQLNGFGYPDYGPDGYEERKTQGYAESSRYADYGYNQGTESWTDIHEQAENTVPPVNRQEDRGGEVKRSEGGPGRGYYLNGVFYPYTEDELNELENNKQ